MKHKKGLQRKRTNFSCLYGKKYTHNNEVKTNDMLNSEQISIDLEKEFKELEAIMNELAQIKKEYYSENIQLETIQKQTTFEIIKSVIQRNLKILKNKKNN